MPDVFVSENEKADEEISSKPVTLDVPSKESERAKYTGHTHNRFSSFRMYPEGIDFETRNKDEKVVLLLRAHPITNIKWILIAGLMAATPSLVRSIGFFDTFPEGFGLIVVLAWYLITMAYALESFLSWYFNVYLVTTLRIVDVDFYNLIYKQVSDATIDKVQDVTYNMGGVVRTIFNYGNVFVQTAAEVSEFEFMAVPSPDRVAKIIQELVRDDIH